MQPDLVNALAEAGDVSCSAFMNELGETTRLCLMAMPPVVIDDMRGAILDVVVAEIAQSGDEALLIKTQTQTPPHGLCASARAGRRAPPGVP